MNGTLPLGRTLLQEAFAALKHDLIHDDGPRISTMRNYRFAIVPYLPTDEFKLRGEVQKLNNDLVANGWVVLSISLQALVLKRARAQGDKWRESVIAMEKRVADRDRSLKYLRDKLIPLVEGENGIGGIADDCRELIRDFAGKHPDKAERTLALVGRAGALYPFFRSSALLKHLDGKTGNVPVVLLYPGERRGNSSLSFMGMLEPDSDYRPRIYP
jgi:bacteriophage exclusion system BrxB-like protein